MAGIKQSNPCGVIWSEYQQRSTSVKGVFTYWMLVDGFAAVISLPTRGQTMDRRSETPTRFQKMIVDVCLKGTPYGLVA